MSIADRHKVELARHLRNRNYEVSDAGVHVPKMRALLRGVYVHNVNGRDEREDPNLIVDQGLTYLLSVGLNNGSKLTPWYLSLYGGNYTPLAELVQSAYPATASEITSNTEGYSDTTRRTWSPASPTTPTITNNASKAAFTIATASSVTIYGAAMHSDNTKGGTTGTLFSAVKFATARVVYDTDVFNLGYTATLTDT